MKVQTEVEIVLALGAVVAVAYLVHQAHALISTGALNPTSSNNLAYRGVNAVGSTLSGQNGWTLGGYVYDLLHPGAAAAATAPTPLPKG